MENCGRGKHSMHFKHSMYLRCWLSRENKSDLFSASAQPILIKSMKTLRCIRLALRCESVFNHVALWRFGGNWKLHQKNKAKNKNKQKNNARDVHCVSRQWNWLLALSPRARAFNGTTSHRWKWTQRIETMAWMQAVNTNEKHAGDGSRLAASPQREIFIREVFRIISKKKRANKMLK